MPYLRLSLAALAFLMLAACAGAASAGLREYPFRLESEQKGDGHEIVAHNDGPAAITVYVSLADQENIASDRGATAMGIFSTAFRSCTFTLILAVKPGISFKSGLGTSIVTT